MQADQEGDSALAKALSEDDQDVMDPLSRGTADTVDSMTTRNSSPEDGMSETLETASIRGVPRTRSGKIASLRAAFERDGSEEGMVPKRRFGGSERPGERIEEYEAEINRWRQELEKEKKLRQAFEHKSNALEESLRSMTAARSDGSHEAQKQEHRAALEQLTLVQQEAKASQNEAANARRQLAELKRNISTSTRIENQVTDSSFSRDMESLYHELQNWVVNNFRRSKTDLRGDEMRKRIDSIAEPRHAGLLKDIYGSFSPARRLIYFQATALVYIMEMFHEPLLFGLPSQDWRRHLRKAMDGLSGVLGPAALNKWRSTTLDVLQRSSVISSSVESAVTGMSQMISLTLTALTGVEQTDARMTTLISIVRKAVNLSHLFRVQRAHYKFILPEPGSDFQPQTMDDLADEDGETTLHTRAVRCATFPAVIKVGDEHGDLPLTQNVIAKAKVLCS